MQATTKQAAPKIDTQTLRRSLHELANLFTGILITSGLLRTGGCDPERIERYSGQLLESAERGATVVREARALLTPPENRFESGDALTDQRDSHHSADGQPAISPGDKRSRVRIN